MTPGGQFLNALGWVACRIASGSLDEIQGSNPCWLVILQRSTENEGCSYHTNQEQEQPPPSPEQGKALGKQSQSHPALSGWLRTEWGNISTKDLSTAGAKCASEEQQWQM